jgi:hypothetical protein
VHDALGVGPGQRLAYLGGHAARLPGGQRAAAQAHREALTVDELGDVVEPLLRVADVVDLDDPRVAHPGQQARLALERGHPRWVLRPPRLDDLDRDGPLQPTVKALIDAAERPLADDRAELVALVQGGA